MNFIKRLEKSKDFWFLLFTSFLFFLMRLPSLFEPNWYGDEGIYQVIGRALAEGRILYKGIWDNKPPLLYIFYGIFNGDQFSLRALSLIFGILSVLVFFFLAKKLFFPFKKGQKVVYITTALYVFLFGLPILEGNIANSENFMHLPIFLGAYLIYASCQKTLTKTFAKSSTVFFLSGLLLGLAFLVKVVAAFDAAAFFVFIAIYECETLTDLFKKGELLAIYVIGCTLPITLSAIFFIAKGSFADFFKASFIQNVGYVGYGNKFIIPEGLLIAKLLMLIFLIVTLAYLYVRKKKLMEAHMFILLWFYFSLFDAFFSQRPYTHYVLTLLPSFCLLTGYLFSEKKQRTFTAFILVISLVLVLKNFTFYGKTVYYYQNFLSFLSGQENVTKYQAFFDKSTPFDYELADYILRHTKSTDNIYLWGNNAQVYVLSKKLPPGRYAVAYHVTFYKDGIDETQKALNSANPKYIIVMKNQDSIPFLLERYKENAILENATIYERLF